MINKLREEISLLKQNQNEKSLEIEETFGLKL